jgi:hypothetical protein
MGQTRDELVGALAARYGASNRFERGCILDEIQPRRTLDRQFLDQGADVAGSRDRMIACPCSQCLGIGDRRLAEAEQRSDLGPMPFHGATGCEEGGTRLYVDAKCRGQARDLGLADISSGLWFARKNSQQHRKAEATRAALRDDDTQVAGRQHPSRLGGVPVEQGTGLAACLRGLPGQQVAGTQLGFAATVDVGVQGAERDPKLIGNVASAVV